MFSRRLICAVIRLRPWMAVTGVAVAIALGTAAPGVATAQQQRGDPDWRPTVAKPAFEAGRGPLILLDEAHRSAQTLGGRYAGFAALVEADGFRILPGRSPLDTPGVLDDVSVLVISNAAVPRDAVGEPTAFTDPEIAAIATWVEDGGSLLLVADHAPHGTAAERLAARFGVTMGKGYAFQSGPEGITTNIDFEGPALGDHPILRGRIGEEPVRRVRTFTGQSLKGPIGSTILLALDDTAREAATAEVLGKIEARIASGEPVAAAAEPRSGPALPAQGLAFAFGAGRVVVLGEAGMLTAQFLLSPDSPPFRFGLNTEGHDGQLFALNTIRWLSGSLP
jgi:hypothetical protein